MEHEAIREIMISASKEGCTLNELGIRLGIDPASPNIRERARYRLRKYRLYKMWSTSAGMRRWHARQRKKEMTLQNKFSRNDRWKAIGNVYNTYRSMGYKIDFVNSHRMTLEGVPFTIHHCGTRPQNGYYHCASSIPFLPRIVMFPNGTFHTIEIAFTPGASGKFLNIPVSRVNGENVIMGKEQLQRLKKVYED